MNLAVKTNIQDQARSTSQETPRTQKKEKNQNSKISKKLQTKNNYTKKEHPSQSLSNQDRILHQLDQRYQHPQVLNPQEILDLAGRHQHHHHLLHQVFIDLPQCLFHQKAVAAPNGQHHSSILEKEKTETY